MNKEEYLKYFVEYTELGHTNFNEFLIAKYEYMEYCFEQSEAWVSDLEQLLMHIRNSLLLDGTEFESKLDELYRTLDV